VHRSKTLRVSSLSGFRPIIRRAIRIAPQSSLLSQFYLHSDSADLLLPHSAVHRSKTLRVSSLSGIRPIIRRAIRIAPQPSLLSQFYLHSDSADLLPQIASSSFRSAPLKNASRFFAVGHSPYQK